MPRLLSTLPTHDKVILKATFPKLTEFINALIKRGLLEVIENELMEYYQKSNSSKLRLGGENPCDRMEHIIRCIDLDKNMVRILERPITDKHW